ncbi:hypothetical protein, partial [Pseudomonas fragariae (ex Marin et al. 2024)]
CQPAGVFRHSQLKLRAQLAPVMVAYFLPSLACISRAHHPGLHAALSRQPRIFLRCPSGPLAAQIFVAADKKTI